MKTTLIVLFLITGAVLSAQRNTYYVSFQPGDLGIGLRYDHKDLYGSLAWGNYRFWGGTYIKNHIRAAVGYKFDMTHEIGNGNVINFFSIGGVYHYYGMGNFTEEQINRQEGLFPVSLELGAGVRMNRVVVGFRFDMVKFEGVVDLGITFR